MPIQTLARMTAVSDQSGEVSQLTASTPNRPRKELTIPDSLFSIHDQAEADTISGSSQGTRNSARRVGASVKRRLKNVASARPTEYCTTIDTSVKTMVLRSTGPK